jgi:hypothetical protein
VPLDFNEINSLTEDTRYAKYRLTVSLAQPCDMHADTNCPIMGKIAAKTRV